MGFFMYILLFLFSSADAHYILLLRKLFCFLYFCHKGNSPRFGPAVRELSFDFTWFQKLSVINFYV